MKCSAVALAIVVALTGCGGSTKTVTVAKPTTVATAATSATSPPTTPRTTASTSTPNCATTLKAADIPPTLCLVNGTYVLAATDNHPIHLPGLTAQFVSAHTASSLSAPNGSPSAQANGIFLVITLRITNTSNSPQTVEEPGSNRFQLSPITSHATYSESFQTENGSDQQSFITQNATPVQPGESQTGDVIFDIPPAVMTVMRHDGTTLVFGTFGQDVTSRSNTKGTPLGVMVIYHRQLQG